MNHTLKVLLFIFVIVALITVSGLISQNILNNTSKMLDKKITSIEGNISANDWSMAESNLLKVKDEWTDIKNTWSVLIDHQEIDNIDITLSRMEKLINCKDKSSSLAEASVLLKYVDHIPKKEAPVLENIF